MVCDGMGGMADGGKASQTAIQMLVSGFKQIAKSKDLFREDSAHSSHRIGTARIMQEITMGKTKTRIINKRLSLSRNLSRDHTISMEY